MNMSPERKKRHFMVLTVLCDIAGIIVSVCLTYAFRFSSGWIPFEGGKPVFEAYWNALVVIIPVYLVFYRAYGLYQTARYIRRIEEIFLVIKASSFAIVVLMAGTFFYRGFSYSRFYLVILWVISCLILSLGRFYLIQWEYRRKAQRKELTRVLLIGANRNARHIIQWARSNPHYGREVIGILTRDENLIGKHFEEVMILGSSDETEKFIASVNPDEVILLDTSFARETITDLVAACEDQMIEFRIGADFYGLMTRNVDVEYISTVPLLGFRALPLDDPWNRMIKRIFDLSVSLILLIVSFPVWLLILILIKITSPGPFFYAQERMGRDQKLFQVLKFRTMRVDAEKETGPIWAKPNDDRRTSIGNFLRRWNLDELPQLLNVFRGDMSLVGPRPERPYFIEKFRDEIPRYMARHKIKSGLTGWAQVNGFRGDTSIQERLKYDLFYMENWSLLFDIEILFMTMSAKAFKNAY